MVIIPFLYWGISFELYANLGREERMGDLLYKQKQNSKNLYCNSPTGKVWWRHKREVIKFGCNRFGSYLLVESCDSICLNCSLARLTIDLSLPHGVGDSPGGGHNEKCISLQKRRERMLDWMSRKMSSNNLSTSFRKPTTPKR